MSVFAEGIVLALIGSVFFALYVIPRKLCRNNGTVFSFLTGLGFFLSSFISYGIHFYTTAHPETFANRALFFAGIAGILWAVGIICLFASIDRIGLSKSNQWKNFQGPIGVLLTLMFLREYLVTNLMLVIAAAAAIFCSAMLFTIRDEDGDNKNLVGVLWAILSAVAFGSVTVFNKYVTSHSGLYAQQVIMSFSVLCTLTIWMFLQSRARAAMREYGRKDIALGLLGGILYFGASFFMLSAYRFIPASVGFTIIQCNAVWVILIGILYFKEIDFQKNRMRISLGFVTAILGVALLAFGNR